MPHDKRHAESSFHNLATYVGLLRKPAVVTGILRWGFETFVGSTGNSFETGKDDVKTELEVHS